MSLQQRPRKKASSTAPLPDTSSCVFRHITRTSRAVAAVYDAALAPANITAGQFNLMMTLHVAGPKSVGDLARLAGMDASTIPRAIKPLVEKSMIAVRDGKDRRQRIISLTAIGHRTLSRAMPAWTKIQRTVVGRLGDKNWNQMIAALAHLRQQLRGQEPV